MPNVTTCSTAQRHHMHSGPTASPIPHTPCPRTNPSALRPLHFFAFFLSLPFLSFSAPPFLAFSFSCSAFAFFSFSALAIFSFCALAFFSAFLALACASSSCCTANSRFSSSSTRERMSERVSFMLCFRLRLQRLLASSLPFSPPLLPPSTSTSISMCTCGVLANWCKPALILKISCKCRILPLNLVFPSTPKEARADLSELGNSLSMTTQSTMAGSSSRTSSSTKSSPTCAEWSMAGPVTSIEPI
mmetsp:Transcript_39188/g.96457  ORF Transcript_39188/g.96457 Transcript_39188/m.96457 type:complete len:246 (-) Transcript_39188:324-1061(-)